jgi:hypothetical protein
MDRRALREVYAAYVMEEGEGRSIEPIEVI